MKERSFVVIQSFMLTELGLKGNELIVYAVIFGYTQDGEHWFYGTRGHLAEWCGATKGTVSNCLNSLMNKGYIRRREVDLGGYTQVQYQAVLESITPYQKFVEGGIKNCNGGVIDSITVNNKEDIKEDNKDIPFDEITDYLNEKAGTHYRSRSAKTRRFIAARWNEGYRLDDFRRVIDHKCREWANTEMRGYIRPETLFGGKFEGYLNTAPNIENVHRARDWPDETECPHCGGNSRHGDGCIYYCEDCGRVWRHD